MEAKIKQDFVVVEYKKLVTATHKDISELKKGDKDK